MHVASAWLENYFLAQNTNFLDREGFKETLPEVYLSNFIQLSQFGHHVAPLA